MADSEPTVIDITPKDGSRAHVLAEQYRAQRIPRGPKRVHAIPDDDTIKLIQLADELATEVLNAGL